MDKELEEMQFLGLFGIYKESCKLIYSNWKIFSKITLALILPISFIFLSNLEFSQLLYTNIMITEIQLGRTSVNTTLHRSLKDHFISELAYLILFEVVYLAFYTMLSLLSTSVVGYTVTCIFTTHNFTFKSVMKVIPKVWKRLIVTFLCITLAFIVFNAVALAVAVAVAITIFDLLLIVNSKDVNIPFYILFSIFILIAYAVGFFYLIVISNLACVVSVLEETYGFKAMMKSRNLIQGKVFITMAILFKIYLSFFVILYVFQRFVVDGGYYWRESMVERVSVAILCFVFFSMLKLFELVIQSVVYFVCKSYHHESIDKAALSNHLASLFASRIGSIENQGDVQLEEHRV